MAIKQLFVCVSLTDFSVNKLLVRLALLPCYTFFLQNLYVDIVSYVTEEKTKNRRSWELLLTLLFDWHNRLYLERGADLHIARLMPLSLTSVKSRLVLPLSGTNVPGQKAAKRVYV